MSMASSFKKYQSHIRFFKWYWYVINGRSRYKRYIEPSYIQYWDVNNLYGWAMLQKLPVNNVGWIKDSS